MKKLKHGDYVQVQDLKHKPVGKIEVILNEFYFVKIPSLQGGGKLLTYTTKVENLRRVNKRNNPELFI